MSGGLAPSKSTVYVSNLVYSLTNNDLHKIFSKYGKVVKVTLVKDRSTRKSKGVAFVQFLSRDEAVACVKVLDGKQMFERTLRCSIARDNGRSTEFIKKKYYPDKTTCYECKETGHLSYECPKNSLGRRTPPPKKEKKKRKSEDTDKKKNVNYDTEEEDVVSEDDINIEPDLETLSAAIQMEQEKLFSKEVIDSISQPPKKIIKKSAYFSDEEDLSD